MANPVADLTAAGQSIWYDSISREILKSGGLAKMVADGWVRGVTSNPSIFQKAVAGSDDYDAALAELSGRGITPYEAFLQVGGSDIRDAADILRPVYDRTSAGDGYVSFEVQASDTQAMMAEAKRMFALVDRPNVFIKIPGTQDGVKAVEDLIADGINVNITLLFEVEVYEQFVESYMKGLERRLAKGEPIDKIASVASFFVSRVDTKADKILPEDSPLRGKVAVANARRAYKQFLTLFAGPRWQKLANAGAMKQRPLWASTGTKNPAYSDVLYVEELVAPDTVNTMPEATLKAFVDHGKVRPAIMENLDDADRVLKEAAAAGIDLHQVGLELLDEGLEAFGSDFDKLLGEIDTKLTRRLAGQR